MGRASLKLKSRAHERIGSIRKSSRIRTSSNNLFKVRPSRLERSQHKTKHFQSTRHKMKSRKIKHLGFNKFMNQLHSRYCKGKIDHNKRNLIDKPIANTLKLKVRVAKEYKPNRSLPPKSKSRKPSERINKCSQANKVSSNLHMIKFHFRISPQMPVDNHHKSKYKAWKIKIRTA